MQVEAREGGAEDGGEGAEGDCEEEGGGGRLC